MASILVIVVLLTWSSSYEVVASDNERSPAREVVYGSTWSQKNAGDVLGSTISSRRLQAAFGDAVSDLPASTAAMTTAQPAIKTLQPKAEVAASTTLKAEVVARTSLQATGHIPLTAGGTTLQPKAEVVAGTSLQETVVASEEGHAEVAGAETEHELVEGEHGEEGSEEIEKEEAEELIEEEKEIRDLVGACMLLGGITFVFFLLYIVHHHDEDVKRHSWNVLSRTISIFVSVLLFVGLNGLIDGFNETHIEPMSIPEELKTFFIITLAYLQFFLFHFMLHFILASYSFKRPPKPGADSDEIKKFDEKRELDMLTWSTLTAHTCGFALMRCTGMLQQLELFRESPLLALVPVILNCLLLAASFRLADVIRSSPYFMRDAQEQVKLWDRASEEAENDVAQLGISFSIAVVIRYSISGQLANAYGLALPVENHGYSQAATLMLAGLIFIAVEFVIVFWANSGVRTSTYTSMPPNVGEDERKKRKKTLMEYESYEGLDPINVYMRRWIFISRSVCAVTFAWCFMYATKWALHTAISSYGYSSAPNSCVQLVVQSLVISFLSFLGISLLDRIKDLESTGRQADEVLEEVMKAVGILVGFSWETSFDAGVEVISELTPSPTMTKMCFAVFIAIVMVPMWERHILRKTVELELKETRRSSTASMAFVDDLCSCGEQLRKEWKFCPHCGKLHFHP